MQGQMNSDYEFRLRQLERNRSKQPVELDTVTGYLQMNQMSEEFNTIFNEDAMYARVLEFKKQLQAIVQDSVTQTMFGLASGGVSIDDNANS